MPDLFRQTKLWLQKWRWYQRNTLPSRRARLHWELMRREVIAAGHARGGRRDAGSHTGAFLLEAGVRPASGELLDDRREPHHARLHPV